MTELKTTDEWEPRPSLAVFLKFGKHFWNSSITPTDTGISSGNAFRTANFWKLESLRVVEMDGIPRSTNRTTSRE